MERFLHFDARPGTIDRIPSILLLTGVFLACAIIFHVLERFGKSVIERNGGASRRSSFLADFTAAVVDGPVLGSIAKLIFYVAIIYAPSLHYDALADWPWWSQFVVFLIVNDFSRYWLHRWHHASDLLWRIHRVHHTAVEMDAMTTFRVHFLEGAIKYGLIILPFHFVNIDRSVILLYSAIDIFKGFWHHANFKTHIGRLNYIFNSAELHWWHHSTEAKGQLANFGSILSIWDWLFGTAYYDKGRWPEKIGVEGMENFPSTYHGMLPTVLLSDEEVIRRYSPDAETSGDVASSDVSKRPSGGHAEVTRPSDRSDDYYDDAVPAPASLAYEPVRVSK